MGFGVWSLGFGVWGLGFGVWSLAFRINVIRRPWRRVGWEKEVKTSLFPSLPPQNADGGRVPGQLFHGGPGHPHRKLTDHRRFRTADPPPPTPPTPPPTPATPPLQVAGLRDGAWLQPQRFFPQPTPPYCPPSSWLQLVFGSWCYPLPPPPPTFHRGSANQLLASFELTSAFKPFNYAPAGSAEALKLELYFKAS